MKLSEDTLTILKNFSSINDGIVIKPGKTLRTYSKNKAILAEATVSEEFPIEFGIHDLNKLLGLVSNNKKTPEVEFEENFLTLKSLGSVRLRYTQPSLIFQPPNKNVSVNYDVSFNLSSEVLNWIFSAASILKCATIVVKSETPNDEISIWAMDVKGAIVDDASVNIGKTSPVAFQAAFDISNLKIIPGSYSVELSSIGVGKFSNTEKNIVYWVALEKNLSKFEKAE